MASAPRQDAEPGLPPPREGIPGTPPALLTGTWFGDTSVTMNPRHDPARAAAQLLRQDRDGKGMLILMGCIPPHKGPPICPISAVIKIQLVSYGEKMQPSQDPGKGLVAPDPRLPYSPGSAW